MQLILCIGHFQNDQGEVKNLEHADIFTHINVGVISFYEMLHSLSQKGFLQISNG